MTSDFINAIKDSGVVGAGGAGFPTHVKLTSKAEFVILNAAECEPLIKVDQQLLVFHTEEILEGLKKIVQETGAKKAIIAIKSKHHDVIERLREKMTESDEIDLFLLQDFYPAGDEQITVYEVLKRIVPRGGIPLDVGCVVCNAETVLNVYQATRGYPVTTTYVTVTGEVARPATYELPIGMTYREILRYCGRVNLEDKAVIDGGPMMGKLIWDFDAPITKTTKAIILLSKDHLVIQKKALDMKQILKQSKTACIQCARCTDLCPRELIGHDVKPHLAMRIANYGLSDFVGLKKSLGCSECGACELYACPNGLSPRKVNSMIKSELAKAGIKPDKNQTFVASPYMDYRKIPVKRLIQRLGLKKFDSPAPLEECGYQPGKVIIPLKQHVGVPAMPAVSEGSIVEKGALIARMEEGKLGANIHSSISGRVVAVTDFSVTIQQE